jgi:hypothetical protein
MNNKFSIGVVIAIVLQVSAFVWWTAQQAQTISQLEASMAELTAKAEQEKQIMLQRDIEDIKQAIEKHEQWIDDNYADIMDLIDFATFTENRWAKEYTSDNTYQRRFGDKTPID